MPLELYVQHALRRNTLHVRKYLHGQQQLHKFQFRKTVCRHTEKASLLCRYVLNDISECILRYTNYTKKLIKS